MISVRLYYYSARRELGLRECTVSDDGESKSSKMARLSFILFNFLGKDESSSEFEAILNAKYLLQGLDEEYSSPMFAY